MTSVQMTYCLVMDEGKKAEAVSYTHLANAGLDKSINQYFAALTNMRSCLLYTSIWDSGAAFADIRSRDRESITSYSSVRKGHRT